MTGQTPEPKQGDQVAMNTPELDARYGRTRAKAGRDRTIAWTGAIAIALVFAVWVIWVTFNGTGATLGYRDIGHKVIDERSTRVSFEVSMPAGLTASCALEVQNETHGIVGWKIVEIPVSEKYTQSFTEVVKTTEQGVTGLIYRCWLT